MKSSLIVISIFLLFGVMTGSVAFFLGAPWWAVLVSTILGPPVLGWLAGQFVIHCLIVLIDEQLEKKGK